MRIRAAVAALLTVLAARAEPLDRIAVSIGTQVITESALILDLRVSAFLDRAPVDLSPAAKRRSAERLTDQLLILREATESHLVLPTNVTAMVGDLRGQFGADYQPALKRYGIQEGDVEAHLLSGLIGLIFTDLRFRPGVQIPEEDLRAYYVNLNGGAPLDTGGYEASRNKIEEIMRRQRTAEALDQWLVTARTAARVQFREAVFR
jgi:hypothetical protein